MKASLLSVLVLLCLLPSISDIPVRGRLEDPEFGAESISEYFDPYQLERREPLAIKQLIGIVIAGLSLLVILLFVFSFLMGPGERIRAKMSERSDPFFTIVTILLLVLLLAMLQTYYNELLAWLKTVMSSG